MTKFELVNLLAREASVPKTHVSRVLDCLPRVVLQKTMAGDSVPLTGLGCFYVHLAEPPSKGCSLRFTVHKPAKDRLREEAPSGHNEQA